MILTKLSWHLHDTLLTPSWRPLDTFLTPSLWWGCQEGVNSKSPRQLRQGQSLQRYHCEEIVKRVLRGCHMNVKWSWGVSRPLWCCHRLSSRCQEHVKRVLRGYQEHVKNMSGVCQEGVKTVARGITGRRVSLGCWIMSRGCQKGVKTTLSRSCQECVKGVSRGVKTSLSRTSQEGVKWVSRGWQNKVQIFSMGDQNMSRPWYQERV